MQTPLRSLLRGIRDARIEGDAQTLISSIVTDSRRAQAGALFVCLPGTRDDGHGHVRDALGRGASAIVAEREVEVPAGTPVVRVPDALTALSPISAELNGRPSDSLTCVGITGTNGKTTTSHLLQAVTRAAGMRFGLIGTLGSRLDGDSYEPLEYTTPSAPQLQRLLGQFRDAGAHGAIVEVSSHALALHRVDDVDFDVAILTNVTHDHLDFHGDFERYRAAKATLFAATASGRRKPAGTCVFNADDETGRAIAAATERKLTYSVNAPDAILFADDISERPQGSTFSVKALRPAPFQVRLPGSFNVANALAAIAGGCALDIDVEAIAEGIASVSEVPGRMSAVGGGPFPVYVDYAHTPDGLRRALAAVRPLAAGRVICVFGCGGDRDAAKRPQMGRIAGELADLAIVTNDNPRFENPDRIIEQIVEGAQGLRARLISQPDRAAAIELAVSQARPGDVVLIAGKGHESHQSVRGQCIPCSDVALAQVAIRRRR
ncbi:MAG: UDP-N-acetylmuramoyl-L-alanyl-D-glutamate--2,6-diaminopimelate ligase [Candidatus Eremiobacteraeota bacterium]|nr:UDP-N-acetylmuramoyl-L-alanyl-D-glutamate--2,6-diaminopimelate ligase [Candidatus Eremiobacteraeota bacterium]MBC5826248.1 UDP-N-acetylmuramoyl-L-alanyl-D-glutamate--2,6-diaminopimelate ligase [Candidatus Eremiobacteraeota bacterium]